MNTQHPVKTPKKLIEVALPLDAINSACVAEGSPFTPRHPRSLHVWWARRRLAAARAVIFGQMVNDPCWKWELEHPKELPPNNLKASWAASRKRLFSVIEDLVKWENTTNEEVLERARTEVRKSWSETCELNKDHPDAAALFNPDTLPAFHDPFAGGGALPLEAQRLGLEAYASDLNPVAVLINLAMIEIPSTFAGLPPVNPEARAKKDLIERGWKGAHGLAEDIRYYGQWMRDEAKKRIGHFYPPVEITADMAKDRPDLKPLVGQKLTVIAWLWARTAKSPNPAFSYVDVPLASSFMLSTKTGKEAYVEPVIEEHGYRFTVKVGKPQDLEAASRGTKSGSSGSSFLCLMSRTPMSFEYLRAEGKAKRIGTRLMAIVAEGERGCVYLPPTPATEATAHNARPGNVPDTELPPKALGFRVQEYGMKRWSDLFFPRQLVALTTFSDLVQEIHERIRADALAVGVITRDDDVANNYADAVAVYYALALSRWTDLFSALSSWNTTNQNIKNLFSRHAIPMVWDFAESNPFGRGASFSSTVETIVKLFASLPAAPAGHASQQDAKLPSVIARTVISTDPLTTTTLATRICLTSSTCG